MAGKKDSTGGTTRKGEAERAIAGVGGIRSSEENMPDLESKIGSFINEWNAVAHPFDWTPRSFDKVLATVHDDIPPLAA